MVFEKFKNELSFIQINITDVILHVYRRVDNLRPSIFIPFYYVITTYAVYHIYIAWEANKQVQYLC